MDYCVIVESESGRFSKASPYFCIRKGGNLEIILSCDGFKDTVEEVIEASKKTYTLRVWKEDGSSYSGD